MVGDLEQWVSGQPLERAWVGFDPARVDEQRRRHALSSQRLDQFRVIAAAGSSTTCVQGQSNDAVAGRQSETTRGTASPRRSVAREYRRTRVFREVRPVSAGGLGVGCGSADDSGTRAAGGTELAESVGSGCTVAARLGAPPERLSAGLQARTVQETVASRKVLRLTSNPIPECLCLIVSDAVGSSRE